MSRHIASLLIIGATALAVASCSDPEITGTGDGGGGQVAFKNLSERENVLFNLEQAYVQRKGTQYDRLIDDNFIFYFDDGDVGGPGGGGSPIPEQWDRTSDVGATKNLLSSVLEAKIELNLTSVNWTPIPQASETWFATTIPYSFEFRVTTDLTYISSGTQAAQFTVRNAGTDTNPVWKLVAWRDIAN